MLHNQTKRWIYIRSTAMKGKLIKIALALFVLIQFVPVNRENPPVRPDDEIVMPAVVRNIVTRACYDCHSNSTQWPWYSYVAPVSFFVAHHVEEGRKELNFSVWQSYSAKRKSKKLKEIGEQVEKGKMPLSGYTLLHGEAALDAKDKQVLVNWTRKADTLYIPSGQ